MAVTQWVAEQLFKRHAIDPPFYGIECGVGWYPLIEDTLQQLIATGWNRQLTQVKQKFGELRIYLKEHDDAYVAVLEAARARSAVLCEGCGRPRAYDSSGIGMAYCNACKTHRRERRHKEALKWL